MDDFDWLAVRWNFSGANLQESGEAYIWSVLYLQMDSFPVSMWSTMFWGCEKG